MFLMVVILVPVPVVAYTFGNALLLVVLKVSSLVHSVVPCILMLSVVKVLCLVCTLLAAKVVVRYQVSLGVLPVWGKIPFSFEVLPLLS